MGLLLLLGIFLESRTMKFPLPLAAALLLVATSLASAQHRLITQGNDKLAIVGKEGKIEWELKWGGIHDIHVLPSGNIMVQQGVPASINLVLSASGSLPGGLTFTDNHDGTGKISGSPATGERNIGSVSPESEPR